MIGLHRVTILIHCIVSAPSSLALIRHAPITSRTNSLWLQAEPKSNLAVVGADSLALFGVIPALALVFPFILDIARSTDDIGVREVAVTALLVSKRVYIYSMAALVVALAALRGAEDSPQLGERLRDLTAELLGLPAGVDNSTLSNLDPASISTMSSLEKLRALDSVSPQSQSIALPALVATSLAASLAILNFPALLAGLGLDVTPGASSSTDSGLLDRFVAEMQGPFQLLAPTLSRVPSAVVISLFTRTELERGLTLLWRAGSASSGTEANVHEEEPLEIAAAAASATTAEGWLTPRALSTVLALGLTAAAFAGPASAVWPVRNLVCMCLAVAVGRAVQIPRLAPVLLGLSALVAYDAVSVLGASHPVAISAAAPASVGVGSIKAATASAAAATSAAPAAGSTVSAVAASTAAATAGAPAAAAKVAGSAWSAGRPASSFSDAAGSSAMGQVALSKAAGSSWQPGLLEVRVGGRLSDLLGLGDAVFPSLLATFAHRFDRRSRASAAAPAPNGPPPPPRPEPTDLAAVGAVGPQASTELREPPAVAPGRSAESSNGSAIPEDTRVAQRTPYLAASLTGFGAGCALCEVLPQTAGSGLPALLPIVPLMAVAVLGLAATRGELADLWRFDPASSALTGAGVAASSPSENP